jgi:hypothetical protein
MRDHPSPPAWRHAFAQLLRLVRYSGTALLFVGLVHFVVLFPAIVCNLLRPCSRQDVVRLDLETIDRALQLDRARHGHYPSTVDGLQGLVDRQGLDAIPRDPWGNVYGYLLWRGCPVIWSYGADGTPGGEGRDADLSNMGAAPPPWILERASEAPPLPPPDSCPGSMEPNHRSDV